MSVLGRAALVGIIYFALARAGLLFVEEAGVAGFWPASGFLLAVLLLTERRRWPTYLAAGALGSVAASVIGGYELGTSVAFGLVNGAEALLAAAVICRVTGGRFEPGSVRGAVALIAGAALGANAATAALGAAVGTVALDGDFVRTWLLWWAAGGVGMIAVAPVVVGVVRARKTWRIVVPERLIEAIAILAGAASGALLVFTRTPEAELPLLDFPFLTLPFVLWAALRLGAFGASITVLVIAAIASMATVSGDGPFALDSLSTTEHVVQLQVFVVLLGAMAQIGGAAVEERRRRLTETVSERDFAAGLLEAAPDAMVVADAAGTITLVNDQVERLFGYRREELIGRSVEVLMPGRYIAPHRQAFARAPHANELRRGVELAAKRKDGTEFPIEISLSPIRSAGQWLATAAIRDISERIEAEAVLRERERQLSEAQAVARLGSWSWSVVDDRIEWTDELCRISGLEPDAAPGDIEAYLELIHPDDRDLAREVIGTAHQTGEPYDFDHRLIHPDGSVRWINGRGRVVLGDDGRAVAMQGTAQDVTDQRAAHAALVQAEERFRRAFEGSSTGMALGGIGGEDEGRFLEVNQALCEMTGYEARQLLGTRFMDLVHPDHLARTRALAQQLRGGEITTMQTELQMIGFGGALRWVAVSTSLVNGTDGAPLHAVIQVQDISERKRFEGQLQYLADHDALTGLFNRRRFEQELEREVGAASRYESGGAVMILDLDNFKYVNDSAGHAAGDELLGGIATALRRRLRGSDTIARVGGDELGVILPHVDEQQARLVAEDLRRTVHEGLWTSERLDQGRATVSIGVAMFANRSQELTGEDLIVEADVAMYEAKEAGRDRIRVYDPAVGRRQRMEANLKWGDRIRAALEEGRFALHAQPIASLQGRGRSHYELLVRMVDPHGDLVPPGTFLYIAERSDLIEGIDRWVIREAVRALAREQQRGNDVVFEVNLSAKSVGNPELPAWIAEQLNLAGADGHGLIFEMTETEAIVNVEGARTFAERLRILGCGFALDDFGAGFASFYYLKHLSFDYLKIDGEFIQNLPRDRTDQMVVRAVVAIARGLGKSTVAEFVGDRETVELLRELGVDFAQGYWIGRPQPLEEINPRARVAVPA